MEDSVALTSKSPWLKSRSDAVTIAFVLAVAFTTVTDAPTARLRPLSVPVVRLSGSLPPVRSRIDETLPTNEPAIFQTRSSVSAMTLAPARLVPVTRSSVAIVLVVSEATATDPAKFTVVDPAPPTDPPAPLAATVPIERALRAATSSEKPCTVARRILASTADAALMNETAPESPAEVFSSPPTLRLMMPPVLASTTDVLVALTLSGASSVAVIVPV